MAGDQTLEVVIERVQARLDGQFRDSDALDVKSLGVLAVDAAAIGVLVATHDAINALWWIPAIGLGLAGLLFLWMIRPRALDAGPDWREFYETYGGGSAEEVGRQMLAELLAAVESNDALTPMKVRLFEVAFALLVLSLLGSVVVGLVR